MTRRVITTATSATWPAARDPGGPGLYPVWPVAATWPKGTAMEIQAGSALEAAVGLGNTRVATETDFRTPKDGSTSN